MVFHGHPVKMQLLSERSLFCSSIKGDSSQRLTITSSGRVWISHYEADETFHERLNGREFTKAPNPQELLDAVAAIFSRPHNELLADDGGSWELILTNGEGEQYRYIGTMDGDGKLKLLSDMIRKALENARLFCFDGDALL